MKGKLSGQGEWGNQIKIGEGANQRFDLRRWLASVWTCGPLCNMNWGREKVLWTSCQSANSCGLRRHNSMLQWLSGHWPLQSRQQQWARTAAKDGWTGPVKSIWCGTNSAPFCPFHPPMESPEKLFIQLFREQPWTSSNHLHFIAASSVPQPCPGSSFLFSLLLSFIPASWDCNL